MNDDQRLLANAYLDGEVSADERARAEADPEVVAEVARLRAVGDALRVTDAPDPQRREAAIEAALDAFELRPAATIATTPSSRSPRRSHSTPGDERAGCARWLPPQPSSS